MATILRKFKYREKESEEDEGTEEQKEKNGEKVELGKRIEISVNGEFQCWDIVLEGQSAILDYKIFVDSPLIKLISGLKSGEEARGKIGFRDAVVKVREVYTPTDSKH